MLNSETVIPLIGIIGAIGIAACPKPTDANVCAGNQTPLCNNGCVELQFVTTKHKDCLGDDSPKNCVPGSGTVGGTQYEYMQNKDNSGGCTSCTSTVISGPVCVVVNCRTARDGTEDCRKDG